ncbi:DUF6773 family protein [Paenibacillus tengchongensis]|uniref:DUF6773 family protein n=1 Tax=Paenibacillus tengchongensis TaxID=2608684 RepID=UPI00124EEF10|nr:DUF6773 family protein [Paenibacillus tengchongensis]
MKGRRITDERVVSELQRIGSHAFVILFAGALVSVFVKVFILSWDLRYWLDSFLIVMAACVYYTFRAVRGGLYLPSDSMSELKEFKKVNMLASGTAAVLYTALMIGSDVVESGGGENLLMTLLENLTGGTVFFLVMTWVQLLFVKRSIKNASKDLD